MKKWIKKWKKVGKNGKNFRKTLAMTLIIMYNVSEISQKEGAL